MVAYLEKQNKVLHCGWKDNAFALAIITFHKLNSRVTRPQNRPKKTLSKAKIARKPFSDQPIMELDISVLYNVYNYAIITVRLDFWGLGRVGGVTV